MRWTRLLIGSAMTAAAVGTVLGGIRMASLWSIGRIGWYDGAWIEVPAEPALGFHVPYRLYVPAGDGPTRLWLRPNNSGVLDDSLAPHHEDAGRLLAASRWQADALDAVVLVPSFVRPASDPGLYTHALDADSLTAPPPYGRPDLQLLAMAEHARGRVGRPVCDGYLIDGFSASGMFASRFVALHPEGVVAAGVGAPGGWPVVPDAELPWPAGIADVLGLVGAEPDVDRWREVPVLHWLGAEDTNDSVPYRDGYPEALAARLMGIGPTPVARWPAAELAFVRSASTFHLDAGAGHGVTRAATDRLLAHFRAHDDRSGCPR